MITQLQQTSQEDYVEIFFILKDIKLLMLTSERIRIFRILRTTWKVDVFIILTCVATYYTHEYLIAKAIAIPTMIPTLLGTALAFFVGFNNNQAYNRWWEARTIWGGLVNDSRSWARSVLEYTTDNGHPQVEIQQIKERMIKQMIGFVYALRDALRKNDDGYYSKFLSEKEITAVKQQTNIPNAILSLNAKNIHRLSELGSINEFRFVQLNELLRSFTDNMGKSERINNTVFPTSYIYFTRMFIWALVIFVTLVLADSIGVWSIVLGWVVGFVYHTSHLNGMGLMTRSKKLLPAFL